MNIDPSPPPITIRRFTNQTRWYVADDTHSPILFFAYGIMTGIVFEPKAPPVIQMVNKQKLFALGAVSGDTLRYHDQTPYTPPAYRESCIVDYDYMGRLYLNRGTGKALATADVLILDRGLATAYWL